ALAGVGGGGGQGAPELARPVGLDDVEIGGEVLEDVPGQHHVGQPRGAVVAGGHRRVGTAGRRGGLRRGMGERAAAVPVERQRDQRRDAAPQIHRQRLLRARGGAARGRGGGGAGGAPGAV